MLIRATMCCLFPPLCGLSCCLPLAIGHGEESETVEKTVVRKSGSWKTFIFLLFTLPILFLLRYSFSHFFSFFTFLLSYLSFFLLPLFLSLFLSVVSHVSFPSSSGDAPTR